jgi:hypothetical protein
MRIPTPKHASWLNFKTLRTKRKSYKLPEQEEAEKTKDQALEQQRRLVKRIPRVTYGNVKSRARSWRTITNLSTTMKESRRDTKETTDLMNYPRCLFQTYLKFYQRIWESIVISTQKK